MRKCPHSAHQDEQGPGKCGCNHAPCRHDAERFIKQRDALREHIFLATSALNSAYRFLREVSVRERGYSLLGREGPEAFLSKVENLIQIGRGYELLFEIEAHDHKCNCEPGKPL